MYLPLIALFIAISGSMGVSYMTENSHPGDALYPIKVQIGNSIKNISAASGTEGSGNVAPSEKASSSSSVYLHASTDESAAADMEDTSLSSTTDATVTSTTNLDANQVINVK